jgi:ABC-type multidrug transport system fused ATPase/permease subunit
MSEPDMTQADRYRERAGRYETDRLQLAQRSRYLSYARLTVFLAAAASILSVFPGPVSYTTLRVSVGVAGLLVFFALVYWHSRIESRERHLVALVRVNSDAAARVCRDWSALAPGGMEGPGATHPYADDLDLFGRASVFQLLGWTGTDAGRSALAAWLADGAAPETIRERQQAVEELGPLEREREAFAAQGRLVEPARQALDELFVWAETGPWFAKSVWAVWAVRLLGVLIVGLIAAHIAGVIDRPFWLWPLGVSVVLMAAFGKRTAQTFARVFSRFGMVRHHVELFAQMADPSFSSPLLRQLQAELRASGTTAAREMDRLSRIAQLADLRLVTLIHPVITLATLWDFHVLVALERWQAETAPHLRRWYAALGQFDALAAMASLRHDNPSWAFPEIDQSCALFEAEQLGHPLIAGDHRVANDVTVGPTGSFLMVTGSNMSGKSTLLRAIGVNVVLAQAGAPVCAERLRMPPLRLCTSIRVQDSLEAGVSYFMAALQRLKLVVETARSVRDEEPRLLYLLDEVLQGTNTAERQVAVRRVLRHLLDRRTIGVVTTHDLELADCDELAAACQAVHFTEGVERHDEGVRLVFDYRLRPGVATSKNALKLLQSVGLDG